ncbi:MAG: alginate export family protein [Planctomycetota bacterium]
MKSRGLTTSLFALVFATNALAEEPADVRDLERRNADLEQRVQQLERKQLDKEVENYLDDAQPFSEAQGEAASVAPGAKKLRIYGQIAFRTEVRDHLYTDDRPDAGRSFNINLMRTRIGFEADVLENLGVTIELQDIRYWGEELSTVGMLNAVDLKQGFIDFRNIGGKPVDVQVGRMMAWYGDQRLVGHLEWVPQGRTYDGVRVQAHPEKWFGDFFAYKIRDILAVDDDQNLFGIYGGPKWLDLYALLLQDQMEGTGETGVSDNSLFLTLGFRFHGAKNGWEYKVEVPVQLGEVNGDDLTAWAFALYGAYNWSEARWQPRLYVEINWASGDKDSTDGKVEQFQTLVPTNHLYYGYADQVGWANIINLRVGVLLRPSPKWKIRFDYHHFQRPEDQGAWVGAAGRVIRPGLEGAGNHLADEFDIVVTWMPYKPFSLEFGYAVFVPGSFIEDTGESPTSHFVYLQGQVIF